MWTCKLVSHDCQAEWKANNPSAVTFSGCRALWGKECTVMFFSRNHILNWKKS